MTPRARTVLAVLVLLLSSALAACGSDKPGPAASSAPGTSASAGANMATAAVDAYVYGYPLVTMEYTRRALTNTVEPQGTRPPWASSCGCANTPMRSSGP